MRRHPGCHAVLFESATVAIACGQRERLRRRVAQVRSRAGAAHATHPRRPAVLPARAVGDRCRTAAAGGLLRQQRSRRCLAGRRAHDPDPHPGRRFPGVDQARRQQPADQGVAAARRAGRDPRGLRGLRQLPAGGRRRVLLLRPAGFVLQRPAGRHDPVPQHRPLRRGSGAGAPGAGPGPRQLLRARPFLGAASSSSSTR